MDLSSTLAPVASRVIAQFSRGVTARLRKSTPTRAADGSAAQQWADVAGLAAAPVLVEDLGVERALKIWGAEQAVHLQATIAVPGGALLTPIGLALQLVGGPRNGLRYLIVGVHQDDTSRTATLACQATRETLGLP